MHSVSFTQVISGMMYRNLRNKYKNITRLPYHPQVSQECLGQQNTSLRKSIEEFPNELTSYQAWYLQWTMVGCWPGSVEKRHKIHQNEGQGFNVEDVNLTISNNSSFFSSKETWRFPMWKQEQKCQLMLRKNANKPSKSLSQTISYKCKFYTEGILYSSSFQVYPQREGVKV